MKFLLMLLSRLGIRGPQILVKFLLRRDSLRRLIMLSLNRLGRLSGMRLKLLRLPATLGIGRWLLKLLLMWYIVWHLLLLLVEAPSLMI